jgi:ankyrin repeat protein
LNEPAGRIEAFEVPARKDQMTRAHKTKVDSGPLFEPAVRGDLSAIETLLGRGEPPEHSGEPHYTPLQAAIGNGHYDVAKALLRHGADAHRTDEKGWTALTLALWDGRSDMIGLLREAGPARTLRDAAGVGDLERVRQLVASGVPVNDGLYRNFFALYFALMGRHIDVARYLVSRGGVPDPTLSVFQGAAKFGVIELVREYLVVRGDDLLPEVSVALWEAASGDHAAVLGLILDRHPATQDELTRLLKRASCCCAIAAIRLLTERGADVDHVDDDGSPLDLALGYSNEETAAALVALGATARAERDCLWDDESPVDDLRIITSESFTDHDGDRHVCVHSLVRDRTAYVDEETANRLRARGVIELETLPDANSEERADGAP